MSNSKELQQLEAQQNQQASIAQLLPIHVTQKQYGPAQPAFPNLPTQSVGPEISDQPAFHVQAVFAQPALAMQPIYGNNNSLDHQQEYVPSNGATVPRQRAERSQVRKATSYVGILSTGRLQCTTTHTCTDFLKGMLSSRKLSLFKLPLM